MIFSGVHLESLADLRFSLKHELAVMGGSSAHHHLRAGKIKTLDQIEAELARREKEKTNATT